MAVKFEQKLGTYEGKVHLLFWEARPDMDSLEEFVVNISYPDFSGEEPRRVQIVRIDNVGKPLHLDQLWREGTPKKKLGWRGSKWEVFSRAVSELKKNWKKYAKRWDRNRGY
ncbi:hypothetical protein AKJ36_00220 [candidate division MSBL1 archaeon SCGC-AAA259I07]|uniref:DUF7718 domain-containing protein n=1 Tax=candidate division MSBL1 archaeon SCGC-AAA259I07 TaxID=1698266 RepID=A0A133UN69_9EURY|nr:hypothetical protein AKJ36_00220 [candidate division MSBL1 archaeon SCGC-AAA259I07]